MALPETTIEQGKLRGSIGTDFRGNTFLKFQGIPYAKPPIGKLRFKPPQPPEKWEGVYDATKERDICYHRDWLRKDVITGSENCLVLNVFTKQLGVGQNNLLPVMFWIHGGGFVVGSGNEQLYGPEFLLTEDVVLVTFNYRLGMLGFLSLDDPSLGVSGNMGFKDMVMALKWVQKNISHFGGDPNNVTIFGESAGGASVHLLVLSPLARGLFHKAIAQSGCAINPWVQGTKGGEKVAKALNLEGVDDQTILDHLNQKSVEELYEIQEKIEDYLTCSEQRPFGLVIESESAESAFLTEEPIKIIMEGGFSQVPFILGYTTGEGMLSEITKKEEDIKFEELVPWSFGYENGTLESMEVGKKIKEFYYGNEEPGEKNRNKKFDLMSDSMFIYGICITVLAHFSKSKASTYLYRVSIETKLNILKNLLNIIEPGVSHMDDIGYLFKTIFTPEIKPGSLEEMGITNFVKLWTNFAKFGDPTPDQLLKVVWKSVTSPQLDLLDIGKDLVVLSNPEVERINFWKSLFAGSPAGRRSECCLRGSK